LLTKDNQLASIY
jgi:thiamine pyrophosphokinase